MQGFASPRGARGIESADFVFQLCADKIIDQSLDALQQIALQNKECRSKVV